MSEASKPNILGIWGGDIGINNLSQPRCSARPPDSSARTTWHGTTEAEGCPLPSKADRPAPFGSGHSFRLVLRIRNWATLRVLTVRHSRTFLVNNS